MRNFGGEGNITGPPWVLGPLVLPSKGQLRSKVAGLYLYLGRQFDRRESTQVNAKSNFFFYMRHAKVADHFSPRAQSEHSGRHL